MIKEAMFYDKLDDDRVWCRLCPHDCRIASGERGFCKVRENRQGILYTLNYNVVSSEALDPIEKKPLYHFYPGSSVYSIGSIGCNFRCKHCQNWTISQVGIDKARIIEISPELAVSRAVHSGARSIAWTYNEPVIWYEYTYDCARLAKEAGLATVYVSNGYISKEALEKISPYLDAIRIDIKAFNNDFYRKIAGARLEPVLESAKLAKRLGMHLEVVNLLMAGYNDDAGELRSLYRWIYQYLGADTPVHLTRSFPNYKLSDLSPTPVQTLMRAYDIAREEGLHFVYIGNHSDSGKEDSFCPGCNGMLIRRSMSGVERYYNGNDGVCPSCHTHFPLIDDPWS